MHLIAPNRAVSEPNLHEVVPDVVRRRSIEEPYGCDERIVCAFDNPNRATPFVLCKVRNEPAQMNRIAHAVLVFDADSDLFTVLVERRRENVESLTEDVVLCSDGGKVFQLQRVAQDRQIHLLMEPGREISRLPAEDLLRWDPLHSRNRGEGFAHAFERYSAAVRCR